MPQSDWFLQITYIIRPKDALKALLSNYPHIHTSDNDIVVWPVISNEVLGWDDIDYQQLAKLTFLMDSYRQWTHNPDTQDLVTEIIGTPPIDIAVFDKWWELERVTLSDGAGNIMRNATLKEVKLVENTGNLHVDSWLKNFSELVAHRDKEKKDKPNWLKEFPDSQ